MITLLGKSERKSGEILSPALTKKTSLWRWKPKIGGGGEFPSKINRKKKSREKVSVSQVKEKIRAGWRCSPGGAVACQQMQRRLAVPHPITIPFTNKSRTLVMVIGSSTGAVCAWRKRGRWKRRRGGSLKRRVTR